jgi:hypothetical protein
MADTTESSVDAGRPEPATATTSAEFVESMRSLKRWTGLGFRQLEKRATAGGAALPRSTLTVALSRDTLPREDLVSAFAHACGCDEDEVARWVAARRRIAAAGDTDTLTPAETAAETTAATTVETPARPVRRRGRRLLRVVAAFVAAAVAITYFVGWGSGPNNPRQAPDRAAPESPGTSRDRAPSPVSTSTAPTPVSPPVTTTQVNQGDVAPAAVDTAPPEPPRSSDSPDPGPPPTQTTPPEEGEPDHVTIHPPGESPIECPMPYLMTGFGPVAQCTQRVGDQARVGLYSPYTGDFGEQTDWLPVVDASWYDGEVQATDEVVAEARGYAVLNTVYAGAVWATQYRDGEGRWGTFNVYTNEFHPAENGWQPLP